MSNELNVEELTIPELSSPRVKELRWRAQVGEEDRASGLTSRLEVLLKNLYRYALHCPRCSCLYCACYGRSSELAGYLCSTMLVTMASSSLT